MTGCEPIPETAERSQAVVRPEQHFPGAVATVPAIALEELCLFRGVEIAELQLGAMDLDAVVRDLDGVERDEPTRSLPVSRLDHEMGNRPGNGVNDHSGHGAADPIATTRLGSDRELRRLLHDLAPLFLANRPDDLCDDRLVLYATAQVNEPDLGCRS